MGSIVHTLMILLMTIASVVEGVYLQPESADVIVGSRVEFVCGTLENVIFIFTGTDTPPGTSVSSTSSTDFPASGGIKVTISFVVTAELNMTRVTCDIVGTNGNRALAATVRVQYMPEVRKETVRTCQLGTYVFFHWPHVFVLDGIIAHYRIVDNFNTNITVSEPRYSIVYNQKDQKQYEAHITLILNETATGNIVHGYTNFTRRLNGTRQLTPEKVAVIKEGNNVTFNFRIDPQLLGSTECSFHENLGKSAKLQSCYHNGSNCKNFSISIEHDNGILFFTSEIINLLRHKFISSVFFYYAGKEIKTEHISTSTYNIQGVNITSGCLSITWIENSTISRIYLLLNSSEGQRFRGNASLSQAVCSFIAQSHSMYMYNISSFAQGNGKWTLQAYDHEEDEEPAYKLGNITIDHQLLKDIIKEIEESQTSSTTIQYILFVLLLCMVCGILAAVICRY